MADRRRRETPPGIVGRDRRFPPWYVRTRRRPAGRADGVSLRGHADRAPAAVIVKKLLPFLLAFVLPLLLIYAWWGGFNPVEIEETTAGPYTYAYLEQRGDYAKLPELAAKARQALAAAGIEAGSPITVLYSNPDLVDARDRIGRAGFLVAADSRVEEPLRIDHIPARRVLAVKVRAGSLLAPSRAYLALDRYLQARGRGIRMPTVERYAPSDSPLRMGVLTVEMDWP